MQCRGEIGPVYLHGSLVEGLSIIYFKYSVSELANNGLDPIDGASEPDDDSTELAYDGVAPDKASWTDTDWNHQLDVSAVGRPMKFLLIGDCRR